MKKYIYYIITAVIVGLALTVLVLSLNIKRIKADRDIYKHNFSAATDELREERLKNGDLLVERDSYILRVEDLERMRISDEKEIKELKKKLGEDVMYISRLEEEIRVRPQVRDTVWIDGELVKSRWIAADRPWYSISGWSESNGKTISTGIDSLTMSVPLKVGLSEDWTIFVRSSNPYVSFGSIDGAVLDREMYLKKSSPRRWGLGVSVGMGMGWNVLADSPGWKNKMYIGPGVSIGVYYRLF